MHKVRKITEILCRSWPAKQTHLIQRGSKWTKSAIFGIFFGFSKITAELFILEEKLCQLKFRYHRGVSFPFSVDRCKNFQLSYYKNRA